MWQGFQGIGAQAGLPRAPAPRFVIPAKAGIQRGGEERGKASRASEANPASQERRPPDSSFRPPTIVMPAPPLRHSGEGRNPEGR